MERGVLAQDQLVVGERVIADALVTEGREDEPLRLRRSRAERADRRDALRGRRVETVVAHSVVVRRPGRQAVQGRVQIELLDRRELLRQARGVQRAHLRLDLPAEVPGPQADPYERLAHRERHLPGDPHLRLRVGAEGEMAGERRDEGAVDPHGRRADGRGGRGGGGRRRVRRGGRAAQQGQAAQARRGPGQRAPPAEAGPQVLVLLRHAQTAGQLLGNADVRCVHEKKTSQ